MPNGRRYSNGDKVLYPTFVNLGEQQNIEGDAALLVVKMKAKKKLKFNLQHTDGMLVDKHQNIMNF
jgi:hypothetical protein